MALIKCEECGQMVSDKASACPHCGCPVKVPMVCPECGEAVTEGDSYCLKCGCPLNHNPQSQVDEQTNYSWDDDEEKPNNKLKWLLGILAALIVFGGAAFYAWQNGMFEHTAVIEDSVAVDTTSQMLAPVIELNANGMYTIDDCPTSYEGLEIEPHISGESLKSVDIKKDGELLQTINVNSSYFETITNVVHFLDANFDNYVDFMVGSGECEQSSALFLWSPEESKFIQALSDGNLSFTGGRDDGFSFCPQTQKVYCGGYSDIDIQYLMSWVGNDLRCDEDFIQAFSKSMYYDNINHRYTILNHKTQDVIFSSDSPQQLPERWKKMARVLTPEEESEYSQSDAEWLQGTWRCNGSYQGTRIAVVLDIQGNRLIEKWNGEVQYDGSFDYVPSQNMIVYNDGKNILPVLPNQQVIKLTDDLYFSKSGSGDMPTSNTSRHTSHTSARATRLEESVQGDIDDLYYMAKTGNMNPANIMFIKQNLPGQIRELIDLYRQENNSEKVNEWTYKLDAVESVLSQIRM